MTQERLMKDRMIRAIVLFVLAFIALLIFIGLYIDETHRVQETYRIQYYTYLTKTNESIDSYLDAEGDLPLRYRRILADMTSAQNFGFLLDEISEEHKRNLTELQACLMKYPEQMQEKEKLEAMRKAVTDISQNLDKGYDEAAELVDSIDKKGY